MRATCSSKSGSRLQDLAWHLATSTIQWPLPISHTISLLKRTSRIALFSQARWMAGCVDQVRYPSHQSHLSSITLCSGSWQVESFAHTTLITVDYNQTFSGPINVYLFYAYIILIDYRPYLSHAHPSPGGQITAEAYWQKWISIRTIVSPSSHLQHEELSCTSNWTQR